MKVEILYPSSEKDTFEPVTNEKGHCYKHWTIREDSLIPKGIESVWNEAEVSVEVSKGKLLAAIKEKFIRQEKQHQLPHFFLF